MLTQRGEPTAHYNLQEMIKACRLLTLAAALGLAACATETRWGKPGADEATLARDQADCRALAAQQSARMGATGLPPATLDPRFGAPSGPSVAEQRLQERELEDRCMRRKGYDRVPVTGDK